MGVAGVLMSVIVKAFSASPLFAQMMKMMKFMVTLILMPIGTFFGALLRPVLIMLLRKFIIPFYSHWMPVLMKIGGQIGSWLAGEPSDPHDTTPPNNPEELSEMSLMEKFGAFFEGWDPNNPFGLSAYADSEGNLKVAIKSGLIDSNGNTIYKPEDIPKAAPDADMNKTEDQEPLDVEAELAGGERQPDGSILLPNGDVIVDGVIYKNADNISSSSTNNNTWGDGEGLPEYVNPITPGEGEELSATQKDTNLMMSNPALWQQQINMKNQVDTGGIIEDALAPIAVLTENPRFAGTPSEGKLSSIHNAGISEGAYEAANATSGHSISDAGRAILEAAGMTGGLITAADGFNGMVNSPTMFMAGEAGSEHVSITPNGGSNGSGGITVNIQNMNGSDNDLRKLKQTILEVIQQSSANRGRL
jgi:hypothetical protein